MGAPTSPLTFDIRMQNITSTATFPSNFDQTVFGFNPPSLPKNMVDMMNFVESISKLPVVNLAVFDYRTTSYSAVNPPPPGFSQVDNYRSIYIDPSGSIRGLSDYELTAKTNLSRWSLIFATVMVVPRPMTI
jgi:hypothetical protein